MSTKKYFLSIFLLSAPCVLYGADTSEKRALLGSSHDAIEQAVDDAFGQLYMRAPDDTSALLGGASTVAGGAAGFGISMALQGMLQQEPKRFIDPFTASAAAGMGTELLKALPALGGSIAAAAITWKVYALIKKGFTAKLERDFERLKADNSAFKQALGEHQKAYEEHVEEVIAQRLKAAEDDLKALLGDWFQQIDATNSEVLGTLSEQDTLLKKLRGQVSPALYEEIDALMRQNANTVKKLEKMHKISPETLEKYGKKHKGNAVARFFGALFHKKSNHNA